MDALEGGGARGPPLNEPRVAVGEDGLPVGVHVQSGGAQPEAASLERQRAAAVARGPGEGRQT